MWLKGPGTGEYDVTFLVYADKDVKINGTYTDEEVDDDDGETYYYTVTINAALKKGWNYLSLAKVISGDRLNNTYTVSQTKPSRVTWKVY